MADACLCTNTSVNRQQYTHHPLRRVTLVLPHLTDKETKAQRGVGTHLRSHSTRISHHLVTASLVPISQKRVPGS
jgi:hypothetical protein